MLFTYLFLLLFIGGFGYYYLNIYKKGKASGGGMMAGFVANEHEKWADVLQPGETIVAYGSGVQWRPAWQAFIAKEMPIMRLVWPTVSYAFIVTDRERVVGGQYTMLGGLKEKQAYPKTSIKIERTQEEDPGFAAKFNPLYKAFGGDKYRTFDTQLMLADKSLRLCGVPEAFLDSVRR